MGIQAGPQVRVSAADVQCGRFPRHASFTPILLGCLVLAAVRLAGAPAEALPGIDANWRHLTSPHFEIYSRNSDRVSRDLLHHLEILRAVFLERMKVEERLHVDVTVFSFRSDREFKAYAPAQIRKQDQVAGFHLFRPDRAVISMAPTRDVQVAEETVFHEYVHHLFQITERNPPLWLNEGTADVLAGMRVERDHVLIGTPLLDRAIYLQAESLVPLDQLFAANQQSRIYADERHTGVFYAQSWALMHYLHFGDGKYPAPAVERFLSVAGNRDTAGMTDLRQLFQSCFGCDYPEMLHRLKRYVRTGSYRAGRHPMPKLPSPATYVARPVPIDEIRVRLAELAVRVEHSGAGKLMLLNAITERPHDPRPLETLGTEAFLEDDQRTAAERWEQALAAGSTNPAVIRELALLEGRQWFQSFDPSFRLQIEATDRIRSRLLRSINAEPAQAAAYEMLAWVEGFAERPDAANVNRVIAQLPSMADKKRALIGLSLVMLRVGKLDSAATMLSHLNTLQLAGVEAQAAERLQTELDTVSAHAPGQLTENPAQQIIAPPPAAPGTRRPSVALPDDL